MAGVILENLSNKKLFGFCVILLLVQIVCFLVGGLIAPKPTDANNHLATKCIDPTENVHKWFIPNGPGECNKVMDFEEAARRFIEANQIVFSVRMPHRPLNMSRSFQSLLTMLRLETQYQTTIPDPPEAMTMIVRVGYRDSDKEDWKELAMVTETRKLECTLDLDADLGVASDGHPYDCEPLPFFELSSCHHKQYLVNIRLPVEKDDEGNALNNNTMLGSITDMWITEIHQTGGFTLVWFTMKTVMTPIPLAFLIWFWLRIRKLRHPPVLMEKFIMVLGIAVTFLNVPIEWLTFWFNIPYMLLISDIRQGIFYATLLPSWVVFTGECMWYLYADTVERTRLSSRQFGAIAFCCFCMFVLDMYERGVQLTNPFFILWSTETGKILHMIFNVMAGICFSAYFLYLCWQVFRNIGIKRLALPHMIKERRLRYEGLIYRFKFFMLFTLLCAALTIIFFILSRVYEDHYKMGHEKTLQISSAFFTGVYGMWNIYVVAVIFFYAPSLKVVSTDDDSRDMHV